MGQGHGDPIGPGFLQLYDCAAVSGHVTHQQSNGLWVTPGRLGKLICFKTMIPGPPGTNVAQITRIAEDVVPLLG